MNIKIIMIFLAIISFLFLERLNSNSYEKAFKSSLFFKTSSAYQQNKAP